MSGYRRRALGLPSSSKAETLSGWVRRRTAAMARSAGSGWRSPKQCSGRPRQVADDHVRKCLARPPNLDEVPSEALRNGLAARFKLRIPRFLDQDAVSEVDAL